MPGKELPQEMLSVHRMHLSLLLAAALHVLIVLGVVWDDYRWFSETEMIMSVPEIPSGSLTRSGTQDTHGMWENQETEKVRDLEQEYIHRWVTHTEHIGNRHVGSLHGAIEMQVVLDASGFVRGVFSEEGPADLAQEARRVIMLAQPYPSFSDELRARREQVTIHRRWLFGSEGMLLTRGLR